MAGSLFSNEEILAGYTRYKITKSYQLNSGQLQVPVAYPNAQSEIIQVGANFGQKVVSWVAERMGAAPTLPDPLANQDSNTVFAYSIIQPDSPDLTASGNSRVYTIAGAYYYYLLSPVEYNSSTMQIPVSPADTSGTETISSSNFNGSLLGNT